MEIALCLFGQPRNYKLGFQNLDKHLISKYNVSTFAHCWWDKSMGGANI